MAMINCPNCGEQISDKSKECIHCKHILVNSDNKICTECGATIEKGATICSKCGCPIEDENNSNNMPRQVVVTKVNINTKKIITICIVSVLLIVVIVGSVIGVKKYNDKKAMNEAIEQAAKLEEEYEKNYKALSLLMLDGAADAETCGNLIKKVWYNSIYEKIDFETSKYTYSDGDFLDFNKSLGNLFADPDFISKIDKIEENQEKVAEMMKKMKNPPESMKESYEFLKEYYDAYITLTNLAINPTGSLQTFSEDFRTADNEFSNYLEKLKSELD